jgi:16S rRNA (uracil1498-N3)-methyltransferase
MKIHRFILTTPLSTGSFEIKDADLVHQIRSVLKLRVGEQVVLSDGNEMECEATIEDVGKTSIRVAAGPLTRNNRESSRRVTLYCAVLKRENFELVLQKATELGVYAIVPLLTSRTVKLDFKRDRAERIVREAAEQSGRGRLLVVHEPMSFEDAMKEAGANDVNVFFDLGDGIGLGDVMKRIASATSVGLFVGPEGGWTGEEREQAVERKNLLASLGPRTLRGETAAIVATFLGTME